MDVINLFMNVVAASATLIALSFFLPPYLLFRYLVSLLRSICSENVAGKIVLITGASSGIGEHLAYEYAKRKARLVLAARREQRLQEVAEKARGLGSPDVAVVQADVSKIDDCKRLVDEVINRFGRVNYLVNNAGINSMCMFEGATDVNNFKPVMDINFWGSVYTTHFAFPHLKKSKGKIVVIASSGAWLSMPRMSFYNASKAAMISFYETLRTEVGLDVGVTIVTAGFTESEIGQGKFLNNEGILEVDEELRDVQVSVAPVGSVQECAKAIVKGACRGDRYLTEPSWVRLTFLWKVLCPELLEWCFRSFYVTKPGTSSTDAMSKKILDVTGAKKFIYPESIQSPELASPTDQKKSC